MSYKLKSLMFTILLVCMLWMMPVFSWAGDLKPAWSTSTLVSGSAPYTSGITVHVTGVTPLYVGTIDNSNYYWVDIYANVYCSNDTATGNIGVSVYSLPNNIGTTFYNVAPFMVNEIAPADYTNNLQIGSNNTGLFGSGTTHFLGRFDQRYIGIKSSKNTAADAWNIQIRYQQGYGTSQ